MMNGPINRRGFALSGGALAMGLGASTFADGASMQNAESPAANLEISRNSAAIHPDVRFAVATARVYQALTSADQFDWVVALSAAMNSGVKKMLGTAPTEIDATAGGAFSLFGGYVTGRFLELMPNTRIVQA